MSGIAKDDDRGGEVIGVAFDTDQREMRVFFERGDELVGCYKVSHTGKLLVKEGRDLIRVLFKVDETSCWKEQRARERPIL